MREEKVTVILLRASVDSWKKIVEKYILINTLTSLRGVEDMLFYEAGECDSVYSECGFMEEKF